MWVLSPCHDHGGPSLSPDPRHGHRLRRPKMPAETTQVLAEFAAALTYDKIPERVRDYCKDVLLDTLACAVAGHQGDETHQLAALSAGLAQSSESTVIGGDRLSLAGATMLNG